jgi:hypothetical protein
MGSMKYEYSMKRIVLPTAQQVLSYACQYGRLQTVLQISESGSKSQTFKKEKYRAWLAIPRNNMEIKILGTVASKRGI